MAVLIAKDVSVASKPHFTNNGNTVNLRKSNWKLLFTHLIGLKTHVKDKNTPRQLTIEGYLRLLHVFSALSNVWTTIFKVI